VLEVCNPNEGEASWRASISSTLQALPQLRGLWLEWFEYPACELPQAAAALSRLEWLYWDLINGRAPLPQGPWQRSLRHVITSFDVAAASEPFLSGAQQLERLSLTRPPEKPPVHDSTSVCHWPAFWSWAEGHRQLRCLQFAPEPDFADMPGTVQPEAVNAVASLAVRRPGLHVECLPYMDDPTLMYRQLLLSQWQD